MVVKITMICVYTLSGILPSGSIPTLSVRERLRNGFDRLCGRNSLPSVLWIVPAVGLNVGSWLNAILSI